MMIRNQQSDSEERVKMAPKKVRTRLKTLLSRISLRGTPEHVRRTDRRIENAGLQKKRTVLLMLVYLCLR